MCCSAANTIIQCVAVLISCNVATRQRGHNKPKGMNEQEKDKRRDYCHSTLQGRDKSEGDERKEKEDITKEMAAMGRLLLTAKWVALDVESVFM